MLCHFNEFCWIDLGQINRVGLNMALHGTLRFVCVFILTLSGLFGETLPAFEVASIRPFERSGQTGHGSIAVSGSNVTMTGYTLSGLLQYAYDMRGYQVTGGPG